MKITLYILILFFFNLIYSQYNKNNDSIIIWNEKRPLTWNDFKNKKNELNIKGEAGALSASVKVNLQYDSSKNTVIYEIFAVAYPNISWSVVKYEDNYGLEHEQLHFDIVKLFSIKMEKEFKKYDNINDYRRIYDSIINVLNKTQDQYDKETAHSILAFNQKMWEFKIRKALQKYGYYKPKFDTLKCKKFHNGKFKYLFENDTVFIERKDSIQFVTYKQSGLKLKQKIKWLSNCAYLAYHTDYIYLPEYTNKFPDEKILVKIVGIKNNVFNVEYVSDKYNKIYLLDIHKL